MEHLESASQKDPYQKLIEVGAVKLAELIPELSQTSDKDKIVDGFIGDVLMERNLPGATFHRFSAEKQKALLEEAGILSLEDLFDKSKLSDSLIAFYKKKIAEGPAPQFDPLTDPSVKEF